MARSCAESTSAHDLFDRVAYDIHRLVPHDGATWFGSDPVTLLVTSPARVEGFEGNSCAPFWHREFHEHDVSLFADLARTPESTAALRIAMDGNPARSARYQDFMRPHGYDDELRGALRLGDTTWGFFGLYRRHGSRHFDADDLDVMRAAGPVIAKHLRSYVQSENPWLGVVLQPGLAMLSVDGRVLSANAQALQWLRELHIVDGDARPDHDLAELGLATTSHEWEVQVGTPLWALLSRAKAVANDLDRRPARLRVRDRNGRWLLLHATSMTPLCGQESDTVAVVIEPASRSEIAPIVVEALSLTSREREVLGALSAGRSTSEIAAGLFLSPHTVRDHIKMIFEKAGVNSRAELTAKLFADHYLDPMYGGLAHAD